MLDPSPDQRALMYGDLYQLLVPGFLTSRVNIGDHTYSLRSLGSADLYRVSGVASEGSVQWKLWLVASSVWMVDGIPLFEASTISPHIIYKSLLKSHRRVVGPLYGTLTDFFRRVREANSFFESFLYEDESRHLWQSLRGGSFSLSHKAGLPGVERLGLSNLQTSWMAWNHLEDVREEQEYQWTLTKIQVSMQSGKAGQKLDARDKVRHGDEKDRRLRAHRKAWNVFNHGEAEAGGPRGYVAHAPKTATDLVDEMNRWVAGELDDHDRVVEEYKNRVREEYLANERAKAEALEASRRASKRVLEADTRTRLRGYTQEEFTRMFPTNRLPGVRTVHEGDPVSRTFNRYLRDVPEPTPEFGGSKAARPSLNELISQRKMKIDG